MNDWLTVENIVFLHKLSVTQLFKKFLTFYEYNRNVIIVFLKTVIAPYPKPVSRKSHAFCFGFIWFLLSHLRLDFLSGHFQSAKICMHWCSLRDSTESVLLIIRDIIFAQILSGKFPKAFVWHAESRVRNSSYYFLIMDKGYWYK
jgi:hypothetical protein